MSSIEEKIDKSKEQTLTDAEAISAYLEDEKVQKQLALAADHLLTVTNGKWRDAEYIRRNSTYHTPQEVQGILSLLILNKNAVSRYNKNRKGVSYKITITPEARKLVINELITEHEKEIEILRSELAAF